MTEVRFGTDIFSELDQRQMPSLFDAFPSYLRSSRFVTFPHINIGKTHDTIKIVVFAPLSSRRSLIFLPTKACEQSLATTGVRVAGRLTHAGFAGGPYAWFFGRAGMEVALACRLPPAPSWVPRIDDCICID